MKGKPLVILLVEDNQDHAEMILRNLQEHRVANQIFHVKDGEAALDYLFQRGLYADPDEHPRPHLILLDLRLPKIDGLEVLQRIKQVDEIRRIPVVVITTSEADSDIRRAYDRYTNSYIVKPVKFKQFSQLMDDLGFYWLGWNRHPWTE